MTPFPNGRDNDMNTLRTRYTLLGTFQLLGPALPILFYFNVSPMRGSLHDIPPLRRGVLDAPALVVGSRASMVCRRSCGRLARSAHFSRESSSCAGFFLCLLILGWMVSASHAAVDPRQVRLGSLVCTPSTLCVQKTTFGPSR